MKKLFDFWKFRFIIVFIKLKIKFYAFKLTNFVKSNFLKIEFFLKFRFFEIDLFNFEIHLSFI